MMDDQTDSEQLLFSTSTLINHFIFVYPSLQTIRFKSYLLSMGIANPVTRETHGSGTHYHLQLAKQLGDMLQAPLEVGVSFVWEFLPLNICLSKNYGSKFLLGLGRIISITTTALAVFRLSPPLQKFLSCIRSLFLRVFHCFECNIWHSFSFCFEALICSIFLCRLIS